MKSSASVLMIHGAGGGGWEFDYWKGHWECSGFEVIAPDLQPSALGLAATEFSDYVDQVVEWTRDCADTLVMVGASMGGLLALAAAERVDVSALVLVNSVLPAGIIEPAPFDLEPPVIWWAGGPLEETEDALPDGELHAIEFAHERWRDESGKVVNQMSAGITVVPPRVPVLVITGLADKDIPPEHGRELARWARADIYEFQCVSHIGPLLGQRYPHIADAACSWAHDALHQI